MDQKRAVSPKDDSSSSSFNWVGWFHRDFNKFQPKPPTKDLVYKYPDPPAADISSESIPLDKVVFIREMFHQPMKVKIWVVNLNEKTEWFIDQLIKQCTNVFLWAEKSHYIFNAESKIQPLLKSIEENGTLKTQLKEDLYETMINMPFTCVCLKHFPTTNHLLRHQCNCFSLKWLNEQFCRESWEKQPQVHHCLCGRSFVSHEALLQHSFHLPLECPCVFFSILNHSVTKCPACGEEDLHQNALLLYIHMGYCTAFKQAHMMACPVCVRHLPCTMAKWAQRTIPGQRHRATQPKLSDVFEWIRLVFCFFSIAWPLKQ